MDVVKTEEGGGTGPAAVVIDPASLPEGYSMMLGDDGCSYVTVVQEGQTYAIPAAEYQVSTYRPTYQHPPKPY